MKETLAAKLYTAYCEAVGGKAFNGDPLPSWDVFGVDASKSKQANAWRTVAQIAMENTANLCEEMTTLCCEIEALPAGEQQTKVSILASELRHNLQP